MQNHLRLDDLLTRNLNIRWFEGVALVQSVCRHVAAAGSRHHDFPASSEIHLCSDGSVLLAGGTTGAGVAGAAHTLAQMLSDDVPVRLRLIVTQATESQSSYATLGEFSDALAYFERPDGPQILRQLYARALLAPPRAEMGAGMEPARVVPEQSAEPHPSARRRAPRTAVLLAGMAALCGTVWVAGYKGGSTQIATSALAALQRTLAKPADKPSAESKPTDTARRTTGRTGKGNGGPRKSAPAKAEHAAHRMPAAERDPMRRLAPEPGVDLATFTVPGTPTPIFLDAEPIVVVASEFDWGSDTEPNGRLYSREDIRVTPPRNVYPKLPTAVDSPGAAMPDLRTVLELTIAKDGSVEGVRLQHPPRDVHEFMLLSAAKAWRFEPAVIEGRPVRFLHRMAVTSY